MTADSISIGGPMRHLPRKDGVSPGLAALECLLVGSIEVASRVGMGRIVQS